MLDLCLARYGILDLLLISFAIIVFHASISSKNNVSEFAKKQTMLPVEERVLRCFCPRSLSVEYDAMSFSEQATLREAIATAVRMRAMSFMTSVDPAIMQSMCPSTDPFVPFLKEMLPHIPDPPSEDMVQYLTELLGYWGAIPSSISQYQLLVYNQRRNYLNNAGKNGLPPSVAMNTSSAVTKRSSKVASWNDQLRKVSFSDLVLFQTAKECYIEGKIVGEAIQPMVGGTTLIQEVSTKRNILISFYNLLPDGICGAAAEPILQQEFPMGATLRVAEPFYKIFGDGQRGIRVDNPRELDVIKSKNSSSNQRADSAMGAKEQGTKFVVKKQYMAAIDSYLQGLRSSSESDMVATVLSNRAQAYTLLEDWGSGFCDAAASLTIRPKSPKTWARYRKCLAQLTKADAKKKKRSLLVELLTKSKFSVSSSTTQIVNKNEAEECKKQGNDAYQRKLYTESIDLYSKALQAGGETTRAILCNWAFCALEMRYYGDVVPSAVASLRVGYSDKAIFRLIKAISLLGDYDLAQRVFDELLMGPPTTVKKFTDLKHQVERCVHYRNVMIAGEASNPVDALALINDIPSCIGNWIHDCVESFATEDKGRGLRATREIQVGSVVLVEWPLVSDVFDAKSNNKNFVSSNTSGRTFQLGSAANLRTIVVNRLRREGILAQVLSHLSDGDTTPDLVPVSELLVSLELFPCLLPTHFNYCETNKTKDLTADHVDKILNINCHGGSPHSTKDLDCHSELYPVVRYVRFSIFVLTNI